MLTLKERTAPFGSVRMVTCDTFSMEDGVHADYADLATAKKEAQKLIQENPQMFKVYIFNDSGKLIYENGNF